MASVVASVVAAGCGLRAAGCSIACTVPVPRSILQRISVHFTWYSNRCSGAELRVNCPYDLRAVLLLYCGPGVGLAQGLCGKRGSKRVLLTRFMTAPRRDLWPRQHALLLACCLLHSQLPLLFSACVVVQARPTVTLTTLFALSLWRPLCLRCTVQSTDTPCPCLKPYCTSVRLTKYTHVTVRFYV